MVAVPPPAQIPPHRKVLEAIAEIFRVTGFRQIWDADFDSSADTSAKVQNLQLAGTACDNTRLRITAPDRGHAIRALIAELSDPLPRAARSPRPYSSRPSQRDAARDVRGVRN